MNDKSILTATEPSGIQVLAIEYVPIQKADFDATYPLDEALNKGTVFPELYLPFLCERGAK